MALKTDPMTAEDFAQLAAKLTRALAVVENARDWCDENDSPLFVFKVATCTDSMRRFARFEFELGESIVAARAGRPYDDETRKPRAIFEELKKPDKLNKTAKDAARKATPKRSRKPKKGTG